MAAMAATPSLPTRIADIVVPQDDVSAAAWDWAHRSLPDYLLTHSVRAYCWGAAIAAGKAGRSTGSILWTASLMHDVGLTRIPRNAACFEVEGGEIARRFLERRGLRPRPPMSWRGRSCSTCSRRSRWMTASKPSCSIVRPHSTSEAPATPWSTPSGRT